MKYCRVFDFRRLPAFGRATIVVAALCCLFSTTGLSQTKWTLVGWNNLGMHCMDSDYSVFSILPPYNVVNAQLISSTSGANHLVQTGTGYTVTYEAMADPDGSFNSTAQGKGNFWDYAERLFGVSLAADEGLPVPGPNRFHMPGKDNTPQGMQFESSFNWFAAYGIPIPPYDDTGKPNQYPMMRLVARNAVGTVLASTRIVLPVSDEMDCKLCHLSGSGPAAEPAAGWANDPDQGRDYRLNILRLHDEVWGGSPRFQEALTALGLNTNGLHATVTVNQHPILCAACHLSEALPGSGRPGIKPLTAAMHGRHAAVRDPRNGLTLDAENNRMSCYACHPGSVTRCLRGAMGKAVAADGSMAMQCQSCHGPMSAVGASTRTGWLNEPKCQGCHTGDAVSNSGQIRYTSVFNPAGQERVVSNTRFATQANAPAAGLSLYRFSRGHGGLQCSACHGSTHAEFPSSHPNDNLQSQDKQGHAGVLADCTACHAAMPSTVTGGPHGMHPTGANWARDHGDYVESGGGPSQCRACHGTDYKGTVLSRAQGDRSFSTEFGARTFWRGFQIGCYNCHNGPNSESASPNTPPAVSNASAVAESGVSVVIPLHASDANGNALALRVVSQPAHGTVALSGVTATYYSTPGYAGADKFTFAASDGSSDSNLGQVAVTVNVADSDSDGVPDWWMREHFGHPTGKTEDLSRAQDDSDQDGLSNAQEYRLETDPQHANSSLRLAGVRRASGVAEVSFNTVLGHTYSLLSSVNPAAGPWQPVATNLFGHPDSIKVEDATAGAQPLRFYKVIGSP